MIFPSPQDYLLSTGSHGFEPIESLGSRSVSGLAP
jgi:hypothetical protein